MDCTNTTPGFSCECKSGYKLDSNSGACVDIDECSDGPNDCHLMAKCDNTPGSFRVPVLMGSMETEGRVSRTFVQRVRKEQLVTGRVASVQLELREAGSSAVNRQCSFRFLKTPATN